MRAALIVLVGCASASTQTVRRSAPPPLATEENSARCVAEMPPEWPPFIAPGGYEWRQQYPARRAQLACCGEGSLRFTHLRVHFRPDAHDDIARAELSPQSDPIDANVETCVQDVVESWFVQPAPRSDMLGHGSGSVTLSFRF